MFQLTNSLQDINSLPIRCPECNKPLIMEDITTLLGEQNLEKLIMLSINKYVSENLATLTFCITKDCPNILRIQNTIAFCSICRKEYCMSCKVVSCVALGFKTPGADMRGEQNRRFCAVAEADGERGHSTLPELPVSRSARERVLPSAVFSMPQAHLLEEAERKAMHAVFQYK